MGLGQPSAPGDSPLHTLALSCSSAPAPPPAGEGAAQWLAAAVGSLPLLGGLPHQYHLRIPAPAGMPPKRARAALPAAAAWVAAVAVLLAAAAPGTAAQRGPTDAQLLLDFKRSFSNGNTVLDSWTNASTDPCTGWRGIKCNGGGRVIEM